MGSFEPCVRSACEGARACSSRRRSSVGRASAGSTASRDEVTDVQRLAWHPGGNCNVASATSRDAHQHVCPPTASQQLDTATAGVRLKGKRLRNMRGPLLRQHEAATVSRPSRTGYCDRPKSRRRANRGCRSSQAAHKRAAHQDARVLVGRPGTTTDDAARFAHPE